MRNTKISGWSAVILAFGFIVCTNEENRTSGNNTTETDTTDTTTTSTGDYTAQADSFKVNSEAGHYLDARTGKKIRIKADPSTGVRTNEETGEPVSYYVDGRTWWVYGSDGGDTVGTARMEGNKLQFRNDKGGWEPFDKKYQMKEEITKTKSDDAKVKNEKDGDTKIKTDEGKIKIDEDGTKVKKDK